MSARSNPFEELERIFERMSRQLDETSHRMGSRGPIGRLSSESGSMAIDLVEHDGEFVATVDLPGFEREDVDLRVSDHTLHLEAEHDEATEESEEDYLRRERRHQSVQRSVRLPEEVDKEAVTARMKNGVLTVRLPKAESEETHEIEIE